MSPTSKKIVKSVFKLDTLVTAIVTAAVTLGGGVLLEKYKLHSAVNVYDSNEFVKRVELLWAKAYEGQREGT
jgi:hypothetical protein